MENNVVSILASRAKEHPNRDVFRSKGVNGKYNSHTWKEFWEASQSCASALISTDSGNGTNIGLLSENCPKWIITDIAIMMSGSVVVPIFATSSKEQIKYIVEHTQMRLLFIGGQAQLESAMWALKNTKSLERIIVFDNSIKLLDSRCISWDNFLKTARTEKIEINDYISKIKPNDPATILYTSGTTGDPKGVVLTQENFIHCFKIHSERLDINETDISLSFLPLSHVFERAFALFMLYKGGVVVFINGPKTVMDEIKIVKPSVMCVVPRFFEKVFDGINNEVDKYPFLKQKIYRWSVKTGEKRTYYISKNLPVPLLLKLKHAIADSLVLSKVRSIFGGKIKSLPCSGAALHKNLLWYFHSIGLFVNYGYGTTETTATVSCFMPSSYDLNTCGTVMPNLEVKISPSNEILVKGNTVFKEYYKNPEATKQAFDDGWYKTGDWGHFTENGDLVMTDRINDIFKTSLGKFVSPQKVETLLLNDVFIDQAIVLGDNRKYLTALVVPSFQKFRAIWTAEGIEKLADKELVEHPRVINFMKERIEHSQRNLQNSDKVIKFKLLSEAFSIENNTLTNTLKIRRKLIAEKYKDMIDEMY